MRAPPGSVVAGAGANEPGMTESAPSSISIRDARPADARAIAIVQVDSWRSTYRGIVAASYLEQLSYEDRAKRWTTNLSAPDYGTKTFTLVAEDAVGGVIGFVSGGPERESDPVHRGELYAIYLVERAQRLGVGRRLIVEVASRLERGGVTTMLVWVLARNSACRFYERLGGIELRRKELEIGGEMHAEVAYGWRDTRALIASPRAR